MCTLILAYRVFDDAPVFLASNRDELLSRPSSPPQLWPHVPGQRSTRFAAPRDEQAGGTWLGVNEWGVVVAITNRFGDPRDGSRRSRGRVVVEALQERYAAVAADGIAALDPAAFNPFHLLIADAQSAHVVWSDGATMHREDLAPGCHVVTERSYLAAPNARAERLEGAIAELVDASALTRSALAELLRQRTVGDIDSTCVLIPELSYGTRSSTLITLGDESTMQFANGAPCELPYDDHTTLLREVLARG